MCAGWMILSPIRLSDRFSTDLTGLLKLQTLICDYSFLAWGTDAPLTAGGLAQLSTLTRLEHLESHYAEIQDAEPFSTFSATLKVLEFVKVPPFFGFYDFAHDPVPQLEAQLRVPIIAESSMLNTIYSLGKVDHAWNEGWN
jgi:hypothetical protein